jgi:hypothetical protein
MKFEQFKPWVQNLQIMENTMLAGILRDRHTHRWRLSLVNRQHSGFPKFENLKS